MPPVGKKPGLSESFAQTSPVRSRNSQLEALHWGLDAITAFDSTPAEAMGVRVVRPRLWPKKESWTLVKDLKPLLPRIMARKERK